MRKIKFIICPHWETWKQITEVKVLTKEKYKDIINKRYQYDFEDWWRLDVLVEFASKTDKKHYAKTYGWTIEEIIEYGKILTRKERQKKRINN